MKTPMRAMSLKMWSSKISWHYWRKPSSRAKPESKIALRLAWRITGRGFKCSKTHTCRHAYAWQSRQPSTLVDSRETSLASQVLLNSQGDGISQDTRSLFANASTNGSEGAWRDALAKQVQEMSDKILALEEEKAEVASSHHNVLPRDRAQVLLYEKIDAHVSLIAAQHTESA